MTYIGVPAGRPMSNQLSSTATFAALKTYCLTTAMCALTRDLQRWNVTTELLYSWIHGHTQCLVDLLEIPQDQRNTLECLECLKLTISSEADCKKRNDRHKSDGKQSVSVGQILHPQCIRTKWRGRGRSPSSSPWPTKPSSHLSQNSWPDDLRWHPTQSQWQHPTKLSN